MRVCCCCCCCCYLLYHNNNSRRERGRRRRKRRHDERAYSLLCPSFFSSSRCELFSRESSRSIYVYKSGEFDFRFSSLSLLKSLSKHFNRNVNYKRDDKVLLLPTRLLLFSALPRTPSNLLQTRRQSVITTNTTTVILTTTTNTVQLPRRVLHHIFNHAMQLVPNRRVDLPHRVYPPPRAR